MEIDVYKAPFDDAGRMPAEIVERKGVGHPDSLCDEIAEKLSAAYSRYCLREFGAVAHHWFDKLVLYGGEADIDFGRGALLRPYKAILLGKAARAVGSREIPILEIAREVAGKVLAERLTGFDPSRHLEIVDRLVDHQGTGNVTQRYRPRSAADLIALGTTGLNSNDCNVCVGFAPFSTLEGIVLQVERLIASSEFRKNWQDIGSDVKVVGIRLGERIDLFLSVPFLSNHVLSESAYYTRKAELAARIRSVVMEWHRGAIDVRVNHGDQRCYLAVHGSAADTGDVGVVGRGNRPNGLITPMRTMSIEAVNGKNPLDHTGKIYSLVCQRAAAVLHSELNVPVQVHLVTLKGRRLDDPTNAIIYVHSALTTVLVERVKATIRLQIDSINAVTQQFIKDGILMH